MCYECFIDTPNGATFGRPSIELAIGKGTGAAFTEAVIGVLNDSAFTEDWGQIEAPCGSVFSTFQNNWLAAKFKAAQGSKHTCRATPDNEYALCLGLHAGVVRGVGRRLR